MFISVILLGIAVLACALCLFDLHRSMDELEKRIELLDDEKANKHGLGVIGDILGFRDV